MNKKYKDLTGEELDKEDFTKTEAEEEKISLSKREKIAIRVKKARGGCDKFFEINLVLLIFILP